MLNIPTGEHEIRYSADGIHWGAAVATTGATFDRSTFFYNPFRKMWVLSLKGVVYDPTAGESVSGTYAGGSARPETSGKGTVGLSRMRRYAEKPTLTDAARSWAEGTAESAEWYQNSCLPTMWVGADRLDPPRADIGTNPELYNLDCVAYESVMVGLFTIWRGVPKNYPNRDKINNVCVGFSRDGFHWDRSNRTPILDVSEDPNAWNCSNVQSAGGCLLTVGDQLYIYASGRQARQSGVCSTGLATMRRDGFASMEAGQQEGTLTTRLVEFSDKHLFVNVAINGGQLQAEVLDENGTVIGPFSRESCVPITSDSTLAQVSWNGAADLSSVAGKHVKFRFHVRNGSLYSFWVSPDPNGASYGYIGAGGPGFSTTRDLPVSAPR
jgi:hypothetical protein